MSAREFAVSVLPGGQRVRRVRFDEVYLVSTRAWLQDPGLVHLIRSTTHFDEREQLDWYAGLRSRTDYAIWGIEVDERPVGVMGIKHIGVDDGAEYFMYIGERSHWRMGIGRWALREVQGEVASRGLRWVHGRIADHNERSKATHFALGFVLVRTEDDEHVIAIPVDQPVP